ncbi:TPA: esterase, partial [Klebsiella pneumoniae]|nr:esterase [Klebsiella pneumoniae]HCJ1967813.1 esterase [Klebsiella pneumoniae]
LAIERLRYTVPKHYFDEALSGSTPKGDDIIEML